MKIQDVQHQLNRVLLFVSTQNDLLGEQQSASEETEAMVAKILNLNESITQHLKQIRSWLDSLERQDTECLDDQLEEIIEPNKTEHEFRTFELK